MKIRQARKEDVKKIIKTAKKADRHPAYWSEEKFKKFIKKEGHKLFITEDKEILIGYLGLKKKDKEDNINNIDFDKNACIAWIAILPEYRNKGIGSRLLKRAEKYVKKWEKKGIWLDCRKDVVGFYKKNNYKLKGFFIKKSDGKRFRKYIFEKKLK